METGDMDSTMRPVLIALLLLIISIPNASALFENNDLQGYVDNYNSNIDKAPGILKLLLGNEIVDVRILLDDGTEYSVGLETDNGMVTGIQPGGSSSPTIVVETSEKTIDAVVSATDPISAFDQARRSGEITITGLTWWTKLKLAGVLSSMEVLKFLYQVFLGQS